ncbi:MAG TPA: hypothetical protein VFW28_15150 [Micropepsaceae bacterium]|nr:hypothetical protein [Micropepsaceae bacterium]
MLEWLENTSFAAWVREDVWGWPVALTLHALGTALVVGFILIIGLRLLGFFRMIPVTSLSRLFPVIWAALLLQFLSGFTLWMSKPARYVADGAFMLKIALIVVGIILTLQFYRTVNHEAGSWEAQGTVSARGVRFVAAALLVWGSVLIAGRLTGYLGSI